MPKICVKCKKQIPDDGLFCPYCGKCQEPQRSRRQRGNGTGSVFKLASGKYRAEVVVGWRADGRKITRSKVFNTKKEAVNYLPQLLAAPRNKVLKVIDYYNQWRKANESNWSHSTTKVYRAAWAAIDCISQLKIDVVKLNDLQKIVDDNSSKSAAYLNCVKIVMRGIYKYAMIDNAVNKDLSDFVVLRSTQVKKQRDAFRADEKAKIWEAWRAGNDFAACPLIMIYSGMRISEFLNLTVSKIDFENKIITGVGVKTEKSKESPIFIPEIILPVLRKVVMKSVDKIYPKSASKFRLDFAAFCREIGIRELNVHCCRHTCATDLIESNVPPAIVQQIMRHENFDTTLIYTHVSTEPILEAMNKAYAENS